MTVRGMPARCKALALNCILYFNVDRDIQHWLTFYVALEVDLECCKNCTRREIPVLQFRPVQWSGREVCQKVAVYVIHDTQQSL